MENAVSQNLRSRGRKAIPVSPEQVEELAALYGTDTSRIAGALGCARSTVKNKIAASESLHAAYRRGCARAGVRVRARWKKGVAAEISGGEAQPFTAVPAAGAPRAHREMKLPRKIQIDAVRLEELAERFRGNRLHVARELGCSQPTLSNRLRESTALREAFARGQERAGVVPRGAKRTVAATVQVSAEDAEWAVLNAIRAGATTRMQIQKVARLSRGVMQSALYALEHEQARIVSTENRRGITSFALNPDASPAETAEEAAPAEQPHAILSGASDADLVLDAIRHGHRTVGQIMRFTNLTNFRLRRALEELEADYRVKPGRETMQHFYLGSEELPR